jgi:hypothetical protein
MAQCQLAKVAFTIDRQTPVAPAGCPWHSRVTSRTRLNLRTQCAKVRKHPSHAAPRSGVALALRHRRPYPLGMPRRAVVAASVVWSCLLAACGASHYVQRGADLYGEGRYVEADEVFERSELRVSRASFEERAAYAAYRGATFVALGDLHHAQHWLSIATELERTHPGSLRKEERDFLDGAWRALANRLPKTPPAPATTVIASSSQAPSPSVEGTPPAPPEPAAPLP